MYIILDSNIWIKEWGLRSSIGSAVRFFIKSYNAVVVLPEVIRLETERRVESALKEHVRDIEKNYRELLAIFGSLHKLILPSSEDIKDKVKAIFDKCGVDLYEVP